MIFGIRKTAAGTVGIIVAGLVLAGCAASHGKIADRNQAPFPDDLAAREIVFTSKQENNWEVFRVRADSGQLSRLTHSMLEEEAVKPSYDGRRVAFVSKRDGDYEIYVMNLDGTSQQRLTFSKGVDEKPVWVRGTSKILFESARDGNWEIYMMDVDGHNQLNLTNTAADEADPVLSPEGNHILFKSMRDGFWRLYLMDLNGTGVVPLERSGYQEGALDDPVWSPDGKEIVFVSRKDGNAEIYKAAVPSLNGPEGGPDFVGSKRLTRHPSADESPVWSPDGRHILFVSDRGGARRIHRMDPDGKYLGPLSSVPIHGNDPPKWSDDSAWVAYVADGVSGPVIEIVNVKDGRQIRLPIESEGLADLEWVPTERADQSGVKKQTGENQHG